MGLAASQARLLFLTSRKSDVEFRQMGIAHDKIGLSRSAQSISDEYTQTLNMRKFTWATDGSSISDKTTDLSYNLLMTPNATNKAGQYLFTDVNGRVVLSDDYADILGGTGVGSASGPKISLSDFLVKKMGVSAADANKFISNGPTFNPTNPTNPTSPTVNPVLQTSYKDQDIFDLLVAKQSFKTSTGGDGFEETFYTKDMNANFPVRFSAGDADADMYKMIDDIAGDVSQALVKVLGTSDKAIYEAFDEAILQTKAFYKDRMDNRPGGDKYESSAINNIKGTCQIGRSYNGRTTFFLDANQMIKVFLMKFDAACARLDGNDKTNPDNFNSQLNKTKWTIARPEKGGTTPNTNTTTKPTDDKTTEAINNQSIADFYINLYNAIKTKGWVRDNNVSNKDYLQNNLRNGSIFIQKLYGNGTWGDLTTGDATSPLRDEKDTEGVNRAEINYKMAKGKLEEKEKVMDLEMKNLETERASLDTEIDSVKSIISKNVERSFKMFG